MPRFTVHLSVVRWTGEAFAAAPDGTRVELVDAAPLLRKTRAAGRTLTGRLALTAEVDEDADLWLVATLPDGAVWQSRHARASDGTEGRWRGVDGDIGAPEDPVVFEMDWVAWLRFVHWTRSGHQPLPAGLPVSAVVHRALGRSTTVATGETDDNGAVTLSTLQWDALDEGLTLEVGPGGPLPEAWSGPDDRDSEDAQGRLIAAHGARMGAPDSPVVFDVSPTLRRTLSGTRARLLTDGPAVLDALLAAIAGAQRSIHVEVMLFFDDEAGRTLADALLKRAQAGVQVRILADWTTTRRAHELQRLEARWIELFRDLPADELAREVRRIEQQANEAEARAEIDGLKTRLESAENVTVLDAGFPSMDADLDVELHDDWQPLIDALPLFTMARVDHRKLVVIDGEEAILGGQNFGDEYLYREPVPDVPPDDPKRGYDRWHDVSVALRGPAVVDCQRLFLQRWVEHGGAGLDPDGPAFPKLAPMPDGLPVRILRTTPGSDDDFQQTILDLLRHAKDRVWVLNPYFSQPDVRDALRDAAGRGLDVRVILPGEHSDSVDYLYAGRMVYGELLDAGVRLREFQWRMSHAKVAVVDTVALIGSCNLNHRSFQRHYEVAAMVQDRRFADSVVADLMEPDWERSRPIRTEDLDELLDVNAAGRVWLEAVVWQYF